MRQIHRRRYTKDFFRVGLESARTSRAYQKRLQLSLDLFLNWVPSAMNDDTTGWELSPARANQLLCLFIQHLFETGGKLYVARHAVAAVQDHFPSLRGHLHRAWNTIKSWHLQVRVRNRTPFPLVLLDSAVLNCWDSGLGSSSQRHDWFCMSVLLRVVFMVYSGPGKFLP